MGGARRDHGILERSNNGDLHKLQELLSFALIVQFAQIVI